ncbi:DUF1642 domain-containing protein [Streptococcus pseudopneumoniae]|uniref:DUF1642 domain-containing protein n=1 Tax=Streptococcus pseudopneumoniae TaxID=257758 RepID=UPI0014869583|nr:DUF1642 domain-containing protein [Streptococcus pseudopneumoniae]
MNKQELIKEFEEIGIHGLNMFGTVVQGIPTETAIDLIKQLDEPEKVKVPQFVADWLSNLKSGLFGLNYDSVSSEIYDWGYDTEDNIRKLHLAFVYGYEVEEEKKFFVKIKCLSEKFKYLNYFEFCCEWLFSQKEETEEYRTRHTRKQLEEADFGWVFDCPGIEIEEVE